jgi:hypothetical protein
VSNTVDANKIICLLSDQKYQNVMTAFEGTGFMTSVCEKLTLCAKYE